MIFLQRWRRDLYVLWIACFIIQMGFSLIMPFLPLYLQELGVQGSAVEMWSGLIMAANFITMAIFSPIWGAVSDRTGRKAMILRSGFGMGVVVCLMALVHNPWQLMGLRLLQGVASGFIPAATAYMASVAPKEHSGYALGMLSTGYVAGSILGPLAGGALAEVMGHRPIFVLTAISSILAAVVVMFLIKEEFTRPTAQQRAAGRQGMGELVRSYPVAISMCVLLFMNMTSVLTAEPIISLFLQTLKTPENLVSLMSGLVFSITGVATVLVAPRVGKLSDRIGSRRVLAACLVGGAVTYVLQGLTTASWQLVALRFVTGLFSGGLMPAANGLIARSVPRDAQGRMFGLTNAAISLGNSVGPVLGGAISYSFGMRSVFPVTGALLLLTMIWVLVGVREAAPVTVTKTAS